MPDKPRQSIHSEIRFRQELLDKAIISTNLEQEIIATTADRIRIQLGEFGKSYASRERWKAPSGICLTAIATLVATDFKSAPIFTPGAWKAAFCILAAVMAVISAVTAWAGWKDRGKGDTEHFLRQLRNSTGTIKDTSQK